MAQRKVNCEVYTDRGIVGKDGAEGKSAYQQAVEGGYQGTEEEFEQALASDIATVANNVTNINAVGNNIENVNTAVDNMAAIIAAPTAATQAAASASQAATSASNASTSASNAAISASEASTNASNAATSASQASTSASNASTSASEAAASATQSSTSASNAQTSETNAATSASNAATSATNASASATTASTKASQAAESASQAVTSETNAQTSETNAAASESNAAASASNASASAIIATTKASEATASAANASASATSASASATSANEAATSASISAANAEIWAEGTDAQVTTLGGEHSSKGWANVSKQYAESIGAALKYKGSVSTYSALPSTGQEIGDTWNVLDTGDNYAWTGTEWDKLSGTVDLSAYRTSADQDIIDATKQDTISDLETIRSGAALGATSVQPEDLATVATSGSYTDLTNKPTIPTVDSALSSTSTNAIQNKVVNTALAGKANATHTHASGDITGLAKVATSGSYTDLTNKPTIPAAVTETTVSGWGFTKNAGTVTSVKINGTAKNPTSGVVDLGTVITAHQDISGKQDVISDLATIRSGAGKGATAVQPGDLATVATSGMYSDLTGTPGAATADTLGLVKPDGTTITVTEDGTISAAGGSGTGTTGLSIGDVVFSYSNLASENPGKLPLFTGETITSANTIYPEFYNWILAHTELQCTSAEYEATLSTYGECAKYVIGSGSLRLPLIKNYIKAANPSEGIKNIEAGLPNITGKTGRFAGRNEDGTGALRTVDYGQRSGTRDEQSNSSRITFDASLSNPIYGKSSTVTPASTTLYPWVVAYTAAIPASMAQAAEFTNALSGKADTNLGNVPSNYDYVVEFQVNADGSWYRKYKSGWIEQGGQTPPVAGGATTTVTLLKPYNNAVYNVVVQPVGAYSPAGEANNVIPTRTTTNFIIACGQIATQAFSWRAEGQGA